MLQVGRFVKTFPGFRMYHTVVGILFQHEGSECIASSTSLSRGIMRPSGVVVS